MQAIGLCRFSYPALGGFQVGHETTEDGLDQRDLFVIEELVVRPLSRLGATRGFLGGAVSCSLLAAAARLRGGVYL